MRRATDELSIPHQYLDHRGQERTGKNKSNGFRQAPMTVRLPQAGPIDDVRLSRILVVVNTIIETTIFSAKAAKIWTRKNYEEFIVYIANNPLAGEVVPRSGGVRKVRCCQSHIL